jgi:hypothetical protein
LSVLVSWNPGKRGGVATYSVARDGVVILTVQRNASEVVDNDVASGGTYQYRVRSNGEDGSHSVYSAAATAVIP